MSRRDVGRRRTVLQLNESERRENYGFGYKPAGDRPTREGAIGALDMMVQYEDSDDEEMEEEEPPPRSKTSWPKFVASSEKFDPGHRPETPPAEQVADAPKLPASLVSNGGSVSPDTTKPIDEIDNKVMDFLAELDSIDGPDTTSSGLDGDPLPATPPHPPDDETTGTESESSDDEPPAAPKKPSTKWQQCLDDATQCYYYWHFETNQVTWEIPPEYSQYLLQTKEYEMKLGKYEREKHEWKVKQREKPPKSKKRKRKKQSLNVFPPLPKADTRSDSKQIPEIGTSSSLATVSIGPPLPPTDNNDGIPLDMPVKASNNLHHIPEPPLPPVVVGPQLPDQSMAVIGPQLPPITDDVALPPIGPQLPPPPPPPEDDVTDSTVKSPAPEYEMPTTTSAIDKAEQDKDDLSSLEDDMDVDEYIHRKLEESVQTHYEYTNKKYEGPQPNLENESSMKKDPESDIDLDIDDIDAELERALEKKQKELRVKEVCSGKRKAPLSDPTLQGGDGMSNKKQKTIGDEDNKSDSNELEKVRNSRAHELTQNIKRKMASFASVIEVGVLVTDKLEFLEITRNKLSKLQILLIEVETRLADWQDGGLSTEHFVKKLQDAAQQLEHYEESAAPQGWSCHWDTKFKRYFYCNTLSGETQWDYPNEKICEETEEIPPENPTEQPEKIDDNCPQEIPTNIETETPVPTSLPGIPEYDEPSPPPLPPDIAHVAPLAQDPPPLPPDETKEYRYPGTLGTLFSQPPPPPPPDEPAPPGIDPVLPMAGVVLPPPPPPCIDEPYSPRSTASSESDVDGVPMKANEETREALQSTDNTLVTETETVVKRELPPMICGKPAHISAAPVLSQASDISHETHNAPLKIEAGEEFSLPIIKSEDNTPQLSPAPITPYEEASCQESTAPTTSHTNTTSKEPTTVKEKKRKKDKSLVGGGLSMKKKNVSNLVQKWQKVQKEVEIEIERKRKVVQSLQDELEASTT